MDFVFFFYFFFFTLLKKENMRLCNCLIVNFTGVEYLYLHWSTYRYWYQVLKASTHYRMLFVICCFCYLNSITQHVLLEHNVTVTRFTAAQTQIEENCNKHTYNWSRYRHRFFRVRVECSTSVSIPGPGTGIGIIASLHSAIHFEGLTLEAVSAELLGFPLTYMYWPTAQNVKQNVQMWPKANRTKHIAGPVCVCIYQQQSVCDAQQALHSSRGPAELWGSVCLLRPWTPRRHPPPHHTHTPANTYAQTTPCPLTPTPPPPLPPWKAIPLHLILACEQRCE